MHAVPRRWQRAARSPIEPPYRFALFACQTPICIAPHRRRRSCVHKLFCPRPAAAAKCSPDHSVGASCALVRPLSRVRITMRTDDRRRGQRRRSGQHGDKSPPPPPPPPPRPSVRPLAALLYHHQHHHRCRPCLLLHSAAAADMKAPLGGPARERAQKAALSRPLCQLAGQAAE